MKQNKPPPNPKYSGGQLVVESLKAEKTDIVFGLIGSAAMEVFDALYDADHAGEMKFIGVRDERSGVHIADGYARASGRVGVFLAGQNGPGATNLTTGLAQAAAAFSPVVSLAGALSSAHVGRDAFQEVDQQALFRPITKKTMLVTQTERIPEIMREAFRIALAPRRGPVHINLPRDILAQTAEVADFPPPEKTRPLALPSADTAAVAAAAALLRQAKKPVIVAGGGLKHGGGDDVLALAETLNAPIATAAGHGDVIGAGHPLNAGQFGPRGNPLASRLVKEADVILALGTRLGFNSTFYSYDNINPQAAIIQVELEPTAIGRYFPVALGIWADAAAAARQIHAHCVAAAKSPPISSSVSAASPVTSSEEWTKRYKSERLAWLKKRDEVSDSTPIQPAALFKQLRRVLPPNAAITMDAGTLCLQATDALNYSQSPSLFTPLDFGLVGFSFACGLGVKLANPERPVISLIGDGGFGMTISELSTAVAYGINTVTLVMNNQCWGAEKAYQRDFFNERYIGADIPSPPFDKLATLYGAAGFRVERVADIADAVAAATTCGKPAVVDIAIDPQALFSFRRDSFTHRLSKNQKHKA